jgi:hypothetical protein
VTWSTADGGNHVKGRDRLYASQAKRLPNCSGTAHERQRACRKIARETDMARIASGTNYHKSARVDHPNQRISDG